MGGVRMPHAFVMRRVRGGGLDRDGNRIPDGEPLQFTAAFAPGVSGEDLAHRTEVSTKATLYLDRQADIVAHDVVLTTEPVAGRWHVDGDPQHWHSPYTGRYAGMVVILTKQEG